MANSTPTLADDQPTTSSPQAEFFELHIRPLLVDKCADCHSGEDDSDSPFSVLSRQALLDGGDFGPSVVPGHARDSLLIHAVKRIHKELQMPPDESDALTRDEISLLSRWIDEGAIWPEAESDSPQHHPRNLNGAEKPAIDPAEDWALLPREVVTPPAVADDRFMASAIDRFLEHKRQATGLTATDRADRRTLIRRASFDLTGLPPTPAEVQQFVTDPADDNTAWTALIDRLLESPHYGERAARLWLDVARYADTQGDVGDIPIQTAWRYRNWVINAFNNDLPIDQFLQAQIAGDILAAQTDDEDAARRLNIATGFVSLSRRFGNRKKDGMHLTIEDTIDTVGRGILGMTLRCARCHDHKFDPIRQTDYYGLYGIFDSTVYPWMGMSDEKSPSNLSPAVPTMESFQKAKEYWDLIARYEYQINNHFRPWLKPTLNEFRVVNKQWTEASQAGTSTDETPPASLQKLTEQRNSILSRHDGRFRELMLHGLGWIKQEKQRLAEEPPVDFVFAVSEGTPHDAKLHRRGNPALTGPPVPRRFLQVLQSETPQIDAGSGRLQLAEWLTQPDHPLTARVFVNRVWQQHFARGLVATPDNFGRQGQRPSHPQLLDWLAATFVQDGWSLKQLHRRIMLSESYQLQSACNETTATADPENVLVTRFQRRRLDAESIRDTLLAVSGELDRTPGQEHAIEPWYRSRFSLNNPFHTEPASNHRSVYLLTQRLFRHSLLDHFDGPDRNTTTARRRVSNVPSQALFLMNSNFVEEQAQALGQLLNTQAAENGPRIDVLFARAFGRKPTAAESESISEFLRQYRQSTDTEASSDTAALTALSRVVLSSNELFFIE